MGQLWKMISCNYFTWKLPEANKSPTKNPRGQGKGWEEDSQKGFRKALTFLKI
jgi:hypothetical protein